MSELRCCLYCGRDTTSKSQICNRCLNGRTQTLFGRSQIDDRKGRKILPISLNPVEDDLEYFNEYDNHRYGDKSIEKFIERKNRELKNE